jgi:hypothetical protein
MKFIQVPAYILHKKWWKIQFVFTNEHWFCNHHGAQLPVQTNVTFDMSALLSKVCPSLLHHGEVITLTYHQSLSQEVMWWADSESHVWVSWWELWSHKPLLLLQCCQSCPTWVARVHCICRQHVGSLSEERSLQQIHNFKKSILNQLLYHNWHDEKNFQMSVNDKNVETRKLWSIFVNSPIQPNYTKK